jgi:hypothetical protein
MPVATIRFVTPLKQMPVVETPLVQVSPARDQFVLKRAPKKPDDLLFKQASEIEVYLKTVHERPALEETKRKTSDFDAVETYYERAMQS